MLAMTYTRKFSAPAGVVCEIAGTLLRVKGPKGVLERSIRFPRVQVTCEETVAMVGTLAAHVNNMCIGVTDGYEYHMKVVYSHFPIQLKLAADRLEINNFLGEKKARYARIEPGVTAKIGSDEVVLSGINKESVGTTAANIEGATRIRNRDPRVFQDGIYTTLRG
jgi:large subunit ribosomal protein L6